ncbi:MAG: TAXI family TRAP transporter solute-binding subunit, partial [Pseudomonadota bacterium]
MRHTPATKPTADNNRLWEETRMTKFTRTLRAAALGAAACGVAFGGAQAAEERNYILATASTGGTYYPVGVAIATLTKVKLQPRQKIGMSAINSAGSGANVKLIRDREAQFAIIQGLFGDFAWNGAGPVEADGKQTHLRSVSMLWPNVEQFIVRSDMADTGTVADFVALKGKGVGASLGRKNSGTIGSNRTILSGFGIDIDNDFDLIFVGYGPSAEAMQNGQIDAMNTPSGPPTSAVTQAFAALGDGITMLEFTDEPIATANAGVSGQLWTEYVIPAGTYPGQDDD